MRDRARCVPAHVVREILNTEFPHKTRSEMGAECDIDERVFGRILDPNASQAPEFMSFDKVDRILTRLGIHHLWHSHPGLIEVYEYLDAHAEKDAAEEERRAQRKELAESDLCKNGHSKSEFGRSKDYFGKKGSYCMECRRIWVRAHRARKAAAA